MSLAGEQKDRAGALSAHNSVGLAVENPCLVSTSIPPADEYLERFDLAHRLVVAPHYKLYFQDSPPVFFLVVLLNLLCRFSTLKLPAEHKDKLSSFDGAGAGVDHRQEYVLNYLPSALACLPYVINFTILRPPLEPEPRKYEHLV